MDSKTFKNSQSLQAQITFSRNGLVKMANTKIPLSQPTVKLLVKNNFSAAIHHPNEMKKLQTLNPFLPVWADIRLRFRCFG